MIVCCNWICIFLPYLKPAKRHFKSTENLNFIIFPIGYIPHGYLKTLGILIISMDKTMGINLSFPPPTRFYQRITNGTFVVNNLLDSINGDALIGDYKGPAIKVAIVYT